MRRTQLYIEDEVYDSLKRLSRERSVTISDLVRRALRKSYLAKEPADAEIVLRRAAGLWKDRKDLGSTGEYIRSLRVDRRRRRARAKR